MKKNKKSGLSESRRDNKKENIIISSAFNNNDLAVCSKNLSKGRFNQHQIEMIYNSFWERWIFKTFFGLSKCYWDKNKYHWYKNYIELSKSNIFEYFFNDKHENITSNNNAI